MGYTTYDFSESLDRVGLPLGDIHSVMAAWGDTEQGGGSWEGGFILRLKDASFAYVTGWCDYTGWGCQDNAEIYRFTESRLPARSSLPGPYEGTSVPKDADWDEQPSDLNRYVQGLISKHDTAL